MNGVQVEVHALDAQVTFIIAVSIASVLIGIVLLCCIGNKIRNRRKNMKDRKNRPESGGTPEGEPMVETPTPGETMV